MATPATPAATAKHLGYLDGLRGLAALLVVLHHAYLQVDFRRQPLTGFARQLVQVFWYGHYAVDLFIVLSGFCLMLPVIKNGGVLRGGAVPFFARRAWRILPPYYLALALSLLLIRFLVGQKTGTHWDVSVPVSVHSVWTHLFLLHDALGDDVSINHVFWSIAVEWRIYFLFPMLVFAWRRFGPVATTMVTIFVSYLLFKGFGRVLGASLNAHYLGLFATGMLGASIAFSADRSLLRWKRLPWGGITVLMSLVVAVLSGAHIWHGSLAPANITDYFVGAWSLALLVLVSRNEQHGLTRLLGSRPLVWVGTFAYSLYLIHAPLLQVLWQYVFPLRDKPLLMLAALFAVGTPAIVGVSYGFFWLCERPFLSKGKKSPNALAVEAALQPAP